MEEIALLQSIFSGVIISVAVEISKVVNKKLRNKDASKNVVRGVVFALALGVVLAQTYVPQEILMQVAVVSSSAIAFYELLWKGVVGKTK